MITARLQSIIDYAHGRVIADVGTDHAFIPIELICTERAEKVIASDIRRGPLDSAMRNINAAGMGDKIETRLGSGLSVLKSGEADMIIVAGMGGEMIEKIIKEDENTARASELILQPMNSQYELRKFLIGSGFTIKDEEIAVEGFKVYNIMLVESGRQEEFERDIYYHVPPYLKAHKNFDKLYEKKLREFNKVISGLERSGECDEEKLERYRQWKEELIDIYSR